MASRATVTQTSRATTLPHLCKAYPHLYPVGGLPLDVGFHNTAREHIALFLKDHLKAIGHPRAIVVADALFHIKQLRGHAGNLEYTRPSVMAYKNPIEDLDPAGAFHVDDDGPPDVVIEILSQCTGTKDIGVGGRIADKMRHYQRVGVREYWIYDPERLRPLKGMRLFQGFSLQGVRPNEIPPQGRYWPSTTLGTRWVVGATQRTSKKKTFTLMRLCRPQSEEWYPTTDEKDKQFREKEVLIRLAEENQRLRDWMEARGIDPDAILHPAQASHECNARETIPPVVRRPS